MDISQIDKKTLAEQLRHPQGEAGEELGKMMAQYNASAVAFSIDCLQVQPRDHVLEIGFGPGEAIAELVRLTPDGYIAGIDQSQTMLDMAEDSNHRAVMQEHVELCIGDANALPYEDDSFDKVLAINVFHFWRDASRELAECKRVLKPGGRVVFYVTHPSSWMQGLRETGVFVAREPQEMEVLLTNAGFRTVEHKELTSSDGKGYAVIATK